MAYNTDRTFVENFTDHPESNGTNYPIHMVYAFSLAAEAGVYAFTFLLHGLFPFLFENSGSRGIKSMADKFNLDDGKIS